MTCPIWRRCPLPEREVLHRALAKKPQKSLRELHGLYHGLAGSRGYIEEWQAGRGWRAMPLSISAVAPLIKGNSNLYELLHEKPIG